MPRAKAERLRSVDFSTKIFVTDTFRDAALANGLREEWFVEVALE